MGSLTRNWTCVPCIARWILKHWAAREVLLLVFYFTPSFLLSKLTTSPGKSESCLHLIHLLECSRPLLLSPSVDILPFLLWFPGRGLSHWWSPASVRCKCISSSGHPETQGWEADAYIQPDIYLEVAHCFKIENLGKDTYVCSLNESCSCSVASDSVTPWNSPWNSPGPNTGVGSRFLFQEIFPSQVLSPGLPDCRQILYQLSHQGSPRILEWVAYPFSSKSSWPRNWTGVSCLAGGFFPSGTTREGIYSVNIWKCLFWLFTFPPSLSFLELITLGHLQ